MKKIVVLTLMVIFGWSMQAQDNAEVKKVQFKPTVKINGRMQYDFEFLKRADSDAGLNGNEFRRLHLSAAGKVAKNLKYKIETSFAHGDIGFRDVYLKYTAGKYGNFAFGSIAEPTGLDMATSSKYIPFFERAMLTAMQDFRWGSGFHYENFGLFDGKATFQFALTNSNGSASGGFKDANLENGMNVVTRFTGTVINDKEAHKVVHLGVNFAGRPYSDLSFRAENHMGADQTSGKYAYTFTGADTRTEIGAELGTTFGPLSVQAEYKTQSYDAPSVDYTMTSYYAFASYFLTGEHRPYKNGAFGRVKPKNDIDNGGYGALEVLARYSTMNASDDVIAVNAGLPQDVNNISLGLNWYLNAHARIMYNYVMTDDGDALGNLNQHLFRIQYDF